MAVKRMTYGVAINEAIKEAMRKDERVFCIGEDIAVMGGSFGVTRGLLQEFGENRVIDTPISEQVIVGSAIGAASAGLVPIAEIMFSDFLMSCMDQIVNQAAKLRYMNGGDINLPMVIRTPGGGGVSAAAQHSQNLEALFVHIPGLKVVLPATPEDAYGLMLTAIEDQNPVIFIENKILYGKSAKIDIDSKPIPFGVARKHTEGSDITLVATSRYVTECVEWAKELKEEGISVEVIDPRTLFPLDKNTILESVRKTGRFIVVTEENKRGAWSAEIASIVAEEAFNSLKKPIERIGSLNVPAPFSGNLENYVMPRKEDVIAAIKRLME